jgi:acetylornithine deacetylase
MPSPRPSDHASLAGPDARLNQQTHPAFADLEHPINLNIGIINGGDWPSTVPGACELHCRLSCYPGQTVEETRREIESAIAGAIAGDSWFAEHPPRLVWDGFQSAGSTVSMDEPSVQLLDYWHQQVFGAPMELKLELASMTCAITTSSGSPPGAMARPGVTGMPPMNGSIYAH